MIHHKSKDYVYLISQPSHAWLSGQLARAWGNNNFKCFEPFSETCLAAEQHDIGWLEWARNPQINKMTGTVYNFLEMPFQSHLDIWEKGSRWALTINKYAALLISKHNTFLLGFHDFSNEPSINLKLSKTFQEKEQAFQDRIIDQLKADSAYADYVGEPWLIFNQKLIKVWDYFSLLLCMGFNESDVIEEVPVDFNSNTDLKLSYKSKNRYIVDPWPFKYETFEVACETKKIPHDQYKSRDLLKRLANTPTEKRSFVITSDV